MYIIPCIKHTHTLINQIREECAQGVKHKDCLGNQTLSAEEIAVKKENDNGANPFQGGQTTVAVMVFFVVSFKKRQVIMMMSYNDILCVRARARACACVCACSCACVCVCVFACVFFLRHVFTSVYMT